ncbi:YraN family protein, partial [Patescibacteria group bacterium]|nr:YraN family protein [Patescibacteria group bacterium]
MSSYKQKIGKLGEMIASNWLKKLGYQILATNWHSQEGEIDIVASRNRILTFIEVKTRRSNRFGSAAESITEQKQAKLIKCIQKYLQANHPADNQQIQIDIVLVHLSPDSKKAEICHLKNPIDDL